MVSWTSNRLKPLSGLKIQLEGSSVILDNPEYHELFSEEDLTAIIGPIKK